MTSGCLSVGTKVSWRSSCPSGALTFADCSCQSERAATMPSPMSATRRDNQATAGRRATSFQRKPAFLHVWAGSVQPGAKPCIRSASRISGVTIRPSGITIAGADGIPPVEPPFSVGTASCVQPSPRSPSVQ
jgi:hypothetical protein